MANLIGQRLGQYEITGLLGEGGMATVYRAQQTTIRRDVAVKVIESRLARTPEFARRFEREAQTVASLSHPFILKVFDYGQQGDLLYLVMELLTGGSLADLIARGPLSPELASRMLDQVAAALDYAHHKGIIHRDLKPQNVLLDGSNNAHLTDFGIAKLLSGATTLTRTGTAMGTPAYMSPEQWQGLELDARTDIYALGIILFEMLSGRQPFNADTPYSMMHKHVNEPPPSIRDLRAELPPGVDRVIQKALAKDRTQRFESALALAEAFKAALQGRESIIAPAHAAGSADRPTIVEATAGQPVRDRQRVLLFGVAAGIGTALVVLALIGLLPGILAGERGTAPSATAAAGAVISPIVPTAASPTPIPAQPTLTPVVPTVDPAIFVEATVAQLMTATARAIPSATPMPTATATPTLDVAQTIAAGIAMTHAADTAIAALSATKTPTITRTPTVTKMPTVTKTPRPATFTATPVPLPTTANPVPAFNCPGALPSRLRVGMIVIYNSGKDQYRLAVRSSPDQQSDILVVFSPAQFPRLEIISGPACNERPGLGNWIWWQVRVVDSGIVGWAIESTTNAYYMNPAN